MINAFRKHLLREVIETLFYDVVRLLGDCGEVRFEQVFIDGTMLDGGGLWGGEGGLSFQAVYDPWEGRSEVRAAAAAALFWL
jgi:hypothetical protein